MNLKLVLFLILLSGVSIISAYGQENRICPLGSHLGKDSFGNQACLDSHTNQVVISPNIPQTHSSSPSQSSYQSNSGSQSSSSSGDNGTIIGIVVFLFIIIIIAGIAKSRGRTVSTTSEPLARRGWTDLQRKEILRRQKGVCAMCGEYSGSFQFDHKDDNHNNNDMDNAQALCPNCHDRKSRELD